jgi:hypothetical protein
VLFGDSSTMHLHTAALIAVAIWFLPVNVICECRGAGTSLCDICSTYQPTAEVLAVSDNKIQKAKQQQVSAKQGCPSKAVQPQPQHLQREPSSSDHSLQPIPAVHDTKDEEGSDSMNGTHAFCGGEYHNSSAEAWLAGGFGGPQGSLEGGGCEADAPSYDDGDFKDELDQYAATDLKRHLSRELLHVADASTAFDVQHDDDMHAQDACENKHQQSHPVPKVENDVRECTDEKAEDAGEEGGAMMLGEGTIAVTHASEEGSDVTDDEVERPIERQLTAAELRTLSLANELAGLPPDAPIDWKQWGVRRKKSRLGDDSGGKISTGARIVGAGDSAENTVLFPVGGSQQAACGDVQDERVWHACDGCRRLVKGWRGSLADLAAAVDIGAVVVSHASSSNVPKAHRYTKV